METLANLRRFALDSSRLVLIGSRVYYAWMGFLLLLVAIGAVAYRAQVREGLIVTNMRDPVSWGFYIGNFTFLVGIAAAATPTRNVKLPM